MNVASINFELNVIHHEDDFFAHLETVLLNAAQKGAELIVLPEYTIGELYCVIKEYKEPEAPSHLIQYGSQYVSTLEAFAKKHQVTIVGGSFFKSSPQGILNICPIVYPDKTTQYQVKNQLVTYEREVQTLCAGTTIIQLHDPRIGVLICYDSEFPEYTRTLCNKGMELLCVPSSTETIHGFNRVRFSCLARAIENQIYVVHSALVGSIGKEPLPTGYGSSAVIGPCAPEFPRGPILSETILNKEDVCCSNLDFNLLHSFRSSGEVKNFQDWKQLSKS